MNFRQKKETARRIAKVEHIPAYRTMLKARGSADAGRIMPDKEALARSLVYNLLDFYSEEQIIAGTIQPGKPSSRVLPETARATTFKKKILKQKNTLPSHGGTSTTLWSGLRTASTQIASTVTVFWQRLKELLLKLWCLIVKLFRR